MREDNMNSILFVDDEDFKMDLDTTIEVHFQQKDHPEGKMISVFVDGNEEFILIPLDVKDGARVKYEGKGRHHPKSREKGDLYVIVHIKKKLPWAIIGIAVFMVISVIAGTFLILSKLAPPIPPATDAATVKGKAESCDHDWILADCTTPRTCRICREITGDPADHQWIDATYLSPKTCSICRKTEGDVLTNPLVEPIRERLPIVTHAISSSQRIYGYTDSNLTEKNNEYYFEPYNDQIVITDITKDGSAMEICYPSSISASGNRTLWFPTDQIISLCEIKVNSMVANKSITTYRYSTDGNTLMNYGRMDSGDEYISLGNTESGYKVIVYPIYRDTVCGLGVEEKIALIE